MKSARNILHLGLDVHKETIAAAIAREGGGEARYYAIIGGTLDALDKVIKKLQPPGIELRFVYETGQCGYVIFWRLKSNGMHCDVVAPFVGPEESFCPREDRPARCPTTGADAPRGSNRSAQGPRE